MHAQSTYFPIEDGRHCTLSLGNPRYIPLTTSEVRIGRGLPSGTFAHVNDGIFTQYATHTRKTPQANPTDETHIYNKIKRTTIWFCGGGGGGGWQFMSSQNTFAGDYIYFHPTSAKTIYFKIYPIWIWLMQDYFFYFPWDLGQNIYIKVFHGQDIYFKNCQPPPPLPRINCSSPNKKGTSFNHSPIVLTAILNT